MADLTESEIKKINEYVFVQGGAWAKEYVAARKAWLQKQKIQVTGELLQSLQQEVLNQFQVGIQIAFKDYGRYIDMKKLETPGGGDDYIENLMAWIQKKNLYNKYLPKFLERYNRTKAPRDIFRRMAWAVARSRHSGRYKPRRWWNKSSTASINDLYNRIAAQLPDLAAQTIAESFKTT